MRDDFLTADWADNHAGFSRDLDKAVVAIRAGLARFWQWDGSTHQLLALVISFAITALTFNTTVA